MDYRDDLDLTLVEPIKLPYPYFGGKSTVMPVIWQRFGNPQNLIDPFFGGGSSILFRPHADRKTETVNDLNCYLSNFWRAVTNAPDEVARHADSPVNECDIHAKHLWLVTRAKFRDRMRIDPDFYDAKIAGWWVHGICSWIGSGWCDDSKYGDDKSYDAFLRGEIKVSKPSQQLPHLGDAGRGVHRSSSTDIHGYMNALSERFRRVRVCCGDWKRVLGDSVTFKHGSTAILLDPPYSHAIRDKTLYATEDDCAPAVREWAITNGDNPLLRIALCGYLGEHDMPDGWECYRWKARGGMGSQAKVPSRSKDNADLETVWFSPHCLKPRKQNKQSSIFDMEPTR